MPNINLIAVIIQEGGKLLSEWLKIKQGSDLAKRQIELSPIQYPDFPQTLLNPYPEVEASAIDSVPIASRPAEASSVSAEDERLKENATGIKSGCIPCSLGHVGTCAGLLNEAMRFARKDGIDEETIDRTGMCLTELNAMERVDLRPEMVAYLPDWEKDMVNELLGESRALRHELEDIENLTPAKLETLAAKTQNLYNRLNRGWFHAKMDRTPNMTEEIRSKIDEKLDEAEENFNASLVGE
jgi:hypothetical protein